MHGATVKKNLNCYIVNFICVKNLLRADKFVTLENITLNFRVVEMHVIAQLQKMFPVWYETYSLIVNVCCTHPPKFNISKCSI
jgi:hypothetical protein